MLANGLFATRTQIGRRIELLLKSRPRGRTGRSVPAAVFLLVFCALAFSLGAELSPQADPGKIIIESKGNKGESVVATIHAGDEDGLHIVLKIKGEVEFNDDHTDIVSISPDGSFTIAEVRDGVERKLKIEPYKGELKYNYKVDGKSRPFDDEARKWFRELLEKTDLDDDGDVLVLTKPGIIIKKPLVISDSKDSHVKILISDPGEVIDIYRDDDSQSTIDISMEGDDEYSRVRISASARVVGRSGDRVVFNITPSGMVRITVKKDGDKHELEVQAGDGDDKEFIYKLNGEVRPYDEKAKKIFEGYISILEDGLELNVKGERI